MKKLLGRFVLFITGWKSSYPEEYKVKKCVMLAAPHTSNWDLLFAMAVYWKEGIHNRFFIKNMYTKGFFGFFFKWLGAIGVDRSKNNNLVDYATELFGNYDELVLMVPAEGTRKKVEKWKTGFYHIATKANVPVALGFLDYKKKLAGVGDLITLSGDFEKDMTVIQDFYKNIAAKHPELYNEKIF
jgi:1-acyl-sn-glycerol-3-phosphate acyltransferase